VVPHGPNWGVVLRGEPVRCVLVDDNDQFLDVARRLLDRGGLTIVGTASTSAEALRSVRDLRPDVTVVDVHLGSESGFDLAEQLRCDANGAQSAVILTSATPEQEFVERVEASSALGFVRKSSLSAQAIHRLLDPASAG
jgi:DNA-binding NarL/FixJ family response regulator